MNLYHFFSSHELSPLQLFLYGLESSSFRLSKTALLASFWQQVPNQDTSTSFEINWSKNYHEVSVLSSWIRLLVKGSSWMDRYYFALWYTERNQDAQADTKSDMPRPIFPFPEIGDFMERFHSVLFFWVFFGFGILVAFALFFFILFILFVLCTYFNLSQGQ